MQKEKTEKREIPTPAIFIAMLEQLNGKAFEKEAVLQCEESGANIAKLQGYLAGVRKYKSLMRENGYIFDIKYDGTTERSLSFFSDDGCELDIHSLRTTVAEIDEMTGTAAYEEFRGLWKEAVETQKHKKTGFFIPAKKGAICISQKAGMKL